MRLEAAPAADERGLLDVARASIAHGVRTGSPLRIDPTDHPIPWRAPAATFVTLRERDGELRGCIGSLEVVRPLVSSVAVNAFRAAHADPRFAPLREDELDGIHVHISVLSELEPIAAASEAELVAALRPGVDGLLLRDGAREATFLPAVWDHLPDALRFIRELQCKAGLVPGVWTRDTEAFRYTARSIG